MELLDKKKYNGFTIVNTYIKNDESRLYEMIHDKTGARLAYLSNNDQNKLFSISFKTLPENHTGVFHILEHSVLCGSKKYPVKEPFVELLKSSMNTFLNAMTFPDKTMYPVSSKNEQDFLNLTSVYLDAVFKPAIYENKNIFLQEGWHYEIRGEEEEATYKGVVLNEMKGATSSVDTIIDNEMMKALYPDNCYQYVSGGAPEDITDLTYEEFLRNHQKYYHPTNAYIYVEGSLHIQKVLDKIESYLDEYTKLEEDFTITKQEKVERQSLVREYSIAQGEETKEKTQISFGKVICDYSEKDKIAAINVLSDYLTGSNDAPLKKAILSQKLAQDFYTVITDGIAQPFFQIQVVNTEKEHLESIQKVIKKTIKEILEKGLDKEKLEASLNQMEFNTRDIGEPKGLMHNILVLNSWLYGGKVDLYLDYNDTFKNLRDHLNTHYFEDVLEDMFDEEGYVDITFIPSDTLSSRQREAEREKLNRIKASWTKEQLQTIIQENKMLDKWHESVDSPEDLATIPHLELKDVNRLPERIESTIKEVEGTTVLVNPSENEGIVYVTAYIELDVADKETLSAYSFIPNFLGSLPTSRSLTEVLYDIKANTGRLRFDIGSTSIPGDLDHVRVFLIAKASVLENKVEHALRLIKEILFETRFDALDYIHPLLLQVFEGFRNDIMSNGHRYAMRRTLASYSMEGKFNEIVDGLEAYYYLARLIKHFEDESSAFVNKLIDLQKTQLVKERLLVSVAVPQYTQSLEDKLVKPLINCFKSTSQKIEGAHFDLDTSKNWGIEIPNGVSYAGVSHNIYKLAPSYHGGWRVLSMLLSYDYLWNEVRVKGGAYGTGFTCGSLGTMAYYSYRDPNISRSIQIYQKSGDFIRKFVESHQSIDPFVISSIAKLEPLRSSLAQSDLLDGNYLRKIRYEDEVKTREQMFNLTDEDLLQFAAMLDAFNEGSSICVIGHKEELEKCQDYLDEIKTLS